MQQLRTTQQRDMVQALVERFGIDGSKVVFFPEEPDYPWLPGKQLAKVAQRSGQFKVVRVEHEKVMEVGSERQLHSQGTVVDLNDRIYSLPGVATVGETIAGVTDNVDPWDLADARAMRSTLDLAGVDPLAALNGPSRSPKPLDPIAANTLARISDNARIHILARDKELIVGNDFSAYRRFVAKFLNEPYDGNNSVVGFTSVQRKSFIETLERYVPAPQRSEREVPPEFADVAEEGKAN
jgi:hypothetical protein